MMNDKMATELETRINKVFSASCLLQVFMFSQKMLGILKWQFTIFSFFFTLGQ